MSNLKAALIQLQCEFVAERNRVNPNGLSWLQYDILHLLQQKGPASPSQLSEKLQIRPSKFSKAVKELKENTMSRKPSAKRMAVDYGHRFPTLAWLFLTRSMQVIPPSMKRRLNIFLPKNSTVSLS